MKTNALLDRVDVSFDVERDGCRVRLDVLILDRESFQQVMMAAQSLRQITLSVDDQEVIDRVPFKELPTSLKEKSLNPENFKNNELASTW